MKVKIFPPLLICLFCLPINAQTYDNYQKEYVLQSLTDGQIEAKRTLRMVLCDYQPSGLYIRKGEKITLNVSNLHQDYHLASMIGFKPMWGNHNKTQENRLRNGLNTVTAVQDGILFFIFVKREGVDANPTTVNIKVTGGKAFPLYKLNRSNLANWQNDLKTMTDAPFVQFISDKVLITIPYKDYLKRPMQNISASFKTIHKVVEWEDELAGFDNSAPENIRTNNRIHYLVDLYSTAKEGESYYMYAANYMIGMKRDNFTDLTEKLDKEWGIWHETGHTHQQNSWTWGSITEISVNMFSLYVQEKFGLPSRLNTIEGGEKEKTFDKARRYLAQPNKKYFEENEDDYNELFTKLVMFYQLRAVYGWDAIKYLHQYFRKNPYVKHAEETDQDKANKFIYAMCLITRNNLVPFFTKWGLNVDSATAGKIKGFNFPLPSVDPAKIFR
jgi:hypothetical protein